jgi:hypothetical protein
MALVGLAVQTARRRSSAEAEVVVQLR